MTEEVNALGQAVGFRVEGWAPPAVPPLVPMAGRTCRVEPLDVARHAADLHEANLLGEDGRNWAYLPYGPFATFDDYHAWLKGVAGKSDPQFHTIVDLATGTPAGVASYLRIDPEAGSIEVGHIKYSPRLQRSIAATEAMYLMMRRAFELGYRRYEWKCDSLNGPSRRAAERLGFRYEGTFRQMMVVKQRSRDSAWYSILDSEWPALRVAFERWLDPGNFDANGRQQARLEDLRT